MVFHVNSPDIMTQEKIDFYEKIYGEKILCYKCGQPIGPGGQKDHLWPDFSDMNRCKECLEKEKEDE
jgi:hypothetical protein